MKKRRAVPSILLSLGLMMQGTVWADGMEEGMSPVLDVQVPSECVVTIDPYELKGQGQVYSEPFSFTNYSDVPVVVTIESIDCIFSGSEEFELSDRPVPALIDSRKKIANLYMKRTDQSQIQAIELSDWNTPDAPVIGESGFASSEEIPDELVIGESGLDEELTKKEKKISMDDSASGYQFKLAPVRAGMGGENQPATSATFEVGGTVNPNPANPWQAGDISIRMTYRIEPVIGAAEQQTNVEDLNNMIDMNDTIDAKDRPENDETNPEPENPFEPDNGSDVTPEEPSESEPDNLPPVQPEEPGSETDSQQPGDTVPSPDEPVQEPETEDPADLAGDEEIPTAPDVPGEEQGPPEPSETDPSKESAQEENISSQPDAPLSETDASL